jgi:hypothetical protein
MNVVVKITFLPWHLPNHYSSFISGFGDRHPGKLEIGEMLNVAIQ